MNRRIGPLAIGMVVLYAALAIGAANCLLLHAEQPPSHHHSQSHPVHSALCAWACQVNPTITVHAGVPLGVVFAVVALLRWYSATPQTRLLPALIYSRGPPR
jgi:hypothetical protein